MKLLDVLLIQRFVVKEHWVKKKNGYNKENKNGNCVGNYILLEINSFHRFWVTDLPTKVGKIFKIYSIPLTQFAEWTPSNMAHVHRSITQEHWIIGFKNLF